MNVNVIAIAIDDYDSTCVDEELSFDEYTETEYAAIPAEYQGVAKVCSVTHKYGSFIGLTMFDGSYKRIKKFSSSEKHSAIAEALEEIQSDKVETLEWWNYEDY